MRTHRILSFALSLVVLVTTLASNAVPAQAAGSLYVDNSLPLCHAGAYPTIAAALAAAPAANAKIMVCAGVYPLSPGATVINGKTNLKLIGKKGAVLQPATNPFGGYLIRVTNSTKVVVQGFTIDGLYRMDGASGDIAIQVENSSATIQKNTIQNWASPGFGLANYMIIGINVAAPAPVPVKIVNNKLINFQSKGIEVSGPAALTISGNTFTTVTAATTAVGTFPIAILVGTPSTGKAHGTIKGNKITMDAFPAVGNSVGIDLYEVGPFVVSGNKIRHVYYGIQFDEQCTYMPDAGGNTFKGNRLQEVAYGIAISVTGSGTCNASIDSTRVTGNKIVNTLGPGQTGIQLLAGASGFAFASAQNMLIKSNTLTHFGSPLYISPSAPHVTISGVFAPNKIKP